jgi:molybdate transport system substrate-binding protein
MRRAAAVLATAALLLAAQPAAAKSKPSGEITVFAASSLTEAFGAIAKQFERRFPGVSVKFDFDSSSNLATQIEQGAPADVFASADDANLQETIRAGAVASPPVVFARNRLAIAVERRKPGLVVVLCTDDVPCGKYAAQAFTKAGVTVTPASKEANAKATLSKVSLGEADAGVVYATDVQAAKGSVIGVEIPDRFNVLASYPAAAVKGSRNAAAAHAWVEFLRSATAQRTLRRFGFLPP